jgi:hypothetical protein
VRRPSGRATTSLVEATRIVDLYRCRWIVEQLFRTLKSQGLDLEDSFISDGDALECLAATALIAAASVVQLVQGRGEAGSKLQASRVFSPVEVLVLEALARKFTRPGPCPAGYPAFAPGE